MKALLPACTDRALLHPTIDSSAQCESPHDCLLPRHLPAAAAVHAATPEDYTRQTLSCDELTHLWLAHFSTTWRVVARSEHALATCA